MAAVALAAGELYLLVMLAHPFVALAVGSRRGDRLTSRAASGAVIVNIVQEEDRRCSCRVRPGSGTGPGTVC
jgi:hypothetical protein